MIKKLWINALYSSPIIALYGVGAFYVFKVIDLELFLYVFIRASGMALLLWAIHIYLILKHPGMKVIPRFLISYFAALALRPLLSNSTNTPVKEIIVDNVYFFIFLSLLPNLIIMIICRSIATGESKLKVESEMQALKLEHSEAQKQVLAKQLQPHFLFNALSVLKSLIVTDQLKAEEFTVRLSHFLQYSIKAQQDDIVPLRTELKFVEDYIALLKMRFEDAFEVQMLIEPASLEKKIPIFALHTLLENVFKHNQFTEKKPLLFSIITETDQIIVTNKRHPATNVQQNNTGLANLNTRYHLIANSKIEIVQTAEEFTVKLPLLT